MNETIKQEIAIAVINGDKYRYTLIGQPGCWNWVCPGGETAGYGANGFGLFSKARHSEPFLKFVLTQSILKQIYTIPMGVGHP